MHSTYVYPKYAYQKPPELQGQPARRYPVVIVGAGPVGMAAALDCKVHGIDAIVLDDDETVSVGSRGLCYSKRALEVLDRIGVGDRVVDKGVNWNVGRTFFRKDEVFNFNLSPESGHKRPGMVNLQQYYLEQYEVEACQQQGIEIRWKNKVIDVVQQDAGVALKVQTPDGVYDMQAGWLIVCDGARSPIRTMLGLDIEGKVFMDRFLIADVVMKADFPAERWFWFDPEFHPNQSVLLHREADDVWRIDFQLGWDADPEHEKKPENVIPRIQAMIGKDREFELEWVSVYTFQCRRMKSFNQGNIVFAGDAAHQVSPFGARGANSGIQDTDNLVWKLKLVIDGKAPAKLLDTYSEERVYAADENILNSTRSTDFITPKSKTSRTFRNAVLLLAQKHAFARKLVNSGRLSVPSFYSTSTLNTPVEAEFKGYMEPGAPMDDAPVNVDGQEDWLLHHVGNRFQALVYTEQPEAVPAGLADALWQGAIAVELVVVSGKPVSGMPANEKPVSANALSATVIGAGPIRHLHDAQGLFRQRYDAREGTTFLVRPDQHIAARWTAPDTRKIAAALARATCNA